MKIIDPFCKFVVSIIIIGILVAPFHVLLAIDRYTATITITNNPSEGLTFVVNSDTRTWKTNNTAATDILRTTNSIYKNTTNLFDNIVGQPFTGPINASQTSTNTIRLIAASGNPLAITMSNQWGFFTIATNASTTQYRVDVPIADYPTATSRTNIASLLVAGINSYATNSFSVNNFAYIQKPLDTNGTWRLTDNTNVWSLNNGIMIYSNIVTKSAIRFVMGTPTVPYISILSTNGAHEFITQLGADGTATVSRDGNPYYTLTASTLQLGSHDNNIPVTALENFTANFSVTASNLVATVGAINTNRASFATATSTPPALNAVQTNGNFRTTVSSGVSLISAAASVSQVELFSTFSGTTNKWIVMSNPGTATTNMTQLNGWISPSGTFWFSNQCTGTATASLTNYNLIVQ